MPLEIITVACLQDNYAYLLHDAATNQTALVDAPEAAPILEELDRRAWRLDQVFITHHHADHVQGLQPLRDRFGCRVTGAAADTARLPPLDVEVSQGAQVSVGANTGTVIEVPGHTVGHIAYHFAGAKAVFTADSLMTAGCGRLFEGSPDQMWDTLCRLARLPPETLVYTGHEYTESNLRFALTIDPDNALLQARVLTARALRAAGIPTVPTQLGNELATNPFLRAVSPEVKAHLAMQGASDAETFAEIRRRKDNF